MSLPPNLHSPRIWQMYRWIVEPLALMRDAADRFGDCFTINIASKANHLVMLSNPEALQTLLTQDEGKIFDAPGDLNNGLLEPVFGTQSVIGLSGNPHRRMRQLMMPPFHGERMRSYGQIMREITLDVMRSWPVGEPFLVQKAMQTISMRVILKAVFGLEEGDRYRQLEEGLAALLDQVSKPQSMSFLYFDILRQDWGSNSPWGSFIRRRERVDRLIYAEINNRRSRPDSEGSDILSLLMAAQDDQGQGLTLQELRDELMTLLLAGHETTATAITWALYWIHLLPEVQDKLRAELAPLDRSLDPNIDPNLDPNLVQRLPYLNAVCAETLRIYPVAMITFPRVLRSPINLCGHDLEPGTIIVGSIYLTHQRPDLYPDPTQFNPDRFLERQFSPFEYLPFGGGARRCIGMAFAQFEMKVVLSTILSQATLVLQNDRPVKPHRRGLTSAPTPVYLSLQEPLGL